MEVGLCQQAVFDFLKPRECLTGFLSRHDVVELAAMMIENNWNTIHTSKSMTSVSVLRQLGLTKRHARKACAQLRALGMMDRHCARYWALNYCRSLAAKDHQLPQSWHFNDVTYPVAIVRYPAISNATFQRKPACRRLFHGTTLHAVQSILQWQSIGRSDHEADFGSGLYCFEDHVPACRWGLTKNVNHAAVIVFDVPITEKDDEYTLRFNTARDMDLEAWTALVLACRRFSGNVRGIDALSPYRDRFRNGLRWIEGPVSDNISGDPVPSQDHQVVAIQAAHVMEMFQCIVGILVVHM